MQRKGLVTYLLSDYRISICRACSLVFLTRSMYYYRPVEKDDRLLTLRIREIAMSRVRYGFWRIYTLLRREGWTDNHKRIYRLYCKEGLNLRVRKRRRRRAAAHRMERPLVGNKNQCWSMYFVTDFLYNGQRFRILTIIDNYSRKCLLLQADQHLRGMDVAYAIELLAQQRGVPQRIQVDNGPEFISKEMDKWAYENNVTLDFSRPGKPTDNPFIESFNGSLRYECLNTNYFLSLPDAMAKLECWRREYNEYRPHSSLQGMTPEEVESG